MEAQKKRIPSLVLGAGGFKEDIQKLNFLTSELLKGVYTLQAGRSRHFLTYSAL